MDRIGSRVDLGKLMQAISSDKISNKCHDKMLQRLNAQDTVVQDDAQHLAVKRMGKNDSTNGSPGAV